MPKLHVLRVFVGDGGAGGNPLGVFLDGSEVPAADWQGVAADLGFSETVFVEDAAGGGLRIFTPGTEMLFAGHPLVGTAWLLAGEGYEVPILRPPAGEVPVRFEGDLTFVSGRPEWAPDFEHVRLDSPAEVDALTGPPEGHDLVGAWAWEDEAEGRVRARVFPARLGIEEDEATGAHAVRLAALLGCGISIHQGRGSLILAEPQPDGSVEIGGRTELVETRDYCPRPRNRAKSRPPYPTTNSQDPMLLTITNELAPATDLGYLLHKNPARAQSFDLPFGRAHVFYPESSPERCTAALLLDVDPVGLVRGRGKTLREYVNDRPYAASSFLSVAISRVFGSALAGNFQADPARTPPIRPPDDPTV